MKISKQPKNFLWLRIEERFLLHKKETREKGEFFRGSKRKNPFYKFFA